MSRPVSPAVYRRRRIAAVLVLLLIIGVLWLIVGLVTGGDDAPTASPTPSATSGESSPAPTEAADGATQVTLTSGEEPCAPEQVRMTPTVPAGQTAGGPVRIDLAVSTSADVPCTLTPETADLLVVISVDGAPIFDSAACVSPLLTQGVALTPRWVTMASTTWTGRRSGAACSDAEAFVAEGSYTIQLGTPGGEPGRTDFELAAAPAPPPAPEPTAEPTPAPPAVDPNQPEEIPPTG